MTIPLGPRTACVERRPRFPGLEEPSDGDKLGRLRDELLDVVVRMMLQARARIDLGGRRLNPGLQARSYDVRRLLDEAVDDTQHRLSCRGTTISISTPGPSLVPIEGLAHDALQTATLGPS